MSMYVFMCVYVGMYACMYVCMFVFCLDTQSCEVYV